MKRLGLIAIAVLLVGALDSCNQTPSGQVTAYTAGVAPIAGSNAPDLHVLMPDGSSKVLSGDTVNVAVAPDAKPGTVSVLDTSRAFGWLAPYPAWFEATAAVTNLRTASATSDEVGPLSTAVEMVFLSPSIFTTDHDASVKVVEALKGTPEVKALATFLKQNASAPDPTAVAGFDTALNAAVESGVNAVAGISVAASVPTSPNSGGHLLTSALGTQLIKQDMSQTQINFSGDGVKAAWNLPPEQRGLSWYGAIYRLDASAYASKDALQITALNPPNTTNLQLANNPVVARIALKADPALWFLKYSYFDLVGTLVDNVAGTFLPDPPTAADTLLNQEGAYAIHLYTCGFGTLGPAKAANVADDAKLIANWPNNTAKTDWALACFNMALQNAMDGLSVAAGVDFGTVPTDDPTFIDALVPLAQGVAQGSIESFGLFELNSLGRDIATSLAKWWISNGAKYVAKNVTQDAALKMLGKVIAKLNPLAVVSNAANLGARFGSMHNLTPWEGAIVVVGDPWSNPGGTPTGSSLSDNFDDLNYTANPSWALVNNVGSRGSMSSGDGYAHFIKTNSGGLGGSVGISIDVDIPVDANTHVSFDALANYRDVGAGCGWTCGEYPANVRITVQDASGTDYTVQYSYNYGTAITDKTDTNFKQYAFSIDQGVWARGQNFRIQDAWPQAVKVTKVHLLGGGWNLDGGIDNIYVGP